MGLLVLVDVAAAAVPGRLPAVPPLAAGRRGCWRSPSRGVALRGTRPGPARRHRRPRAQSARDPRDWELVDALGVFGFGIPLGVVAGMVAVHVRARRSPDRAMRAALWASRGLAANFVLCLALNLSDSPLADGAFYAATLTTSIGAFAATAAVVILRDRAVEVDLLLRRAFIVAGVAVGSLLCSSPSSRWRRRWLGRRRAPWPRRAGRGTARGPPADPRARRRRPRAVRAPRPVDRRAAARRAARARGRACRRVAGRGERAARDARGVAVRIDPCRRRRWIRPRGRNGAVRAGDRAHGQPPRPALGRLVVGARAPGERYGPADVALAEILVRQVALVLDALRMAAALQHLRERRS